MTEAEHGVLCKRLERDADKGKQIGDGDGAAFFFGARALLDEGVDGHDEEASGNAEKSEQDEDGPVADAGKGKQDCHNEDGA